MEFELILFDIDGTLLDFDLAEKNALKETLIEYGFLHSDEILDRYHEINIFYWKELEKGKINKQELAYKRYEQLFKEYKIETDIETFNLKYRKRLSEGAYLLENAEEICRYFYKKVITGVASNGGEDIQIKRIKKVRLDKYLDYLFISEDIGYNKPDVRYFEYIFKKVKNIQRNKILIVGDSLTADILGGKNSGIKTCWYNPKKIENKENIYPDFEITDLMQLKNIVVKNKKEIKA